MCEWEMVLPWRGLRLNSFKAFEDQGSKRGKQAERESQAENTGEKDRIFRQNQKRQTTGSEDIVGRKGN